MSNPAIAVLGAEAAGCPSRAVPGLQDNCGHQILPSLCLLLCVPVCPTHRASPPSESAEIRQFRVNLKKSTAVPELHFSGVT